MDDDEDNDYVDDYASRVTLGAPIVNTNDGNANSIPDYLDDDDGDGLANFLDPDHATYYQDTDGDGLVDFFDPDQGGLRYGRLGEPDSDADGIVNYQDGSDIPLPLDWLTFEVTQSGGYAILDWTTTNEIDVSHFEIERSTDGEIFDYIGTVPARNVANEVNAYQYSDIVLRSKLLYYRVRQVDFDGQHTYSMTRVLIIGETRFDVSLYPNPVSNQVHIELGQAAEGYYHVIDLSGKTILSGYLPADRTQHTLELGSLSTGVYQVLITIGDQREVRRIIKN